MRQHITISFIATFLIIFTGLCGINAQPTDIKNAAEIELALRKLRVLGSVLYVAAHPDDENTAVLAYLSKEKLVRTAYLSLTRGEGGQNLIGSETGDALGMLRTGELLSARKIDGALQFFTRALDFGYSKSVDETLGKWNKEKILSDIVFIIRSFQPDVIITRFSESSGGHGHHLSSAILAREAFFAAGDPDSFPEQLEHVSPWKAKRIVWNTWNPDVSDRDSVSHPLIAIDLGLYNTLLGKSYPEIAALSRSMHKSQGFGVSARRGPYVNYFINLDGQPYEKDLFDGVDLSWNRVPQAAFLDAVFRSVQESFKTDAPYLIIDQLLGVRARLLALKPSFWIKEKLKEIDSIIQSCSGLWLELLAENYYYSPGDSLNISLKIINRSPLAVEIKKVRLAYSSEWTEINQPLANNSPVELTKRVLVPTENGYTSPAWLASENKSTAHEHGEFVITMSGENLTYDIPLLYRWTDRIKGEMYRPVEIGPPLSIEIKGSAIVFTNRETKEVEVILHSQTDSIAGLLSLDIPDGWNCEPREIHFSMSPDIKSHPFSFRITPPAEESHSRMSAHVKTGNQDINLNRQLIMYDHVETMMLLSKAEADLVYINLKKAGDRIAYIMGSGDEIPQSLEQIGYHVHLLTDEELTESDLSSYDAIICGTRAYNVRASLNANQARLMSYVHKGGTLITLHNTRFGLPAENTGPYPFQISRQRVSDEQSPVTFLHPDHPLVKKPNKITTADFDNWIQERGLYFASEWDSSYVSLFAFNDPGEESQSGGFLYTAYGKGHYIFSPLAWFRQLPAGVAGAYRLFANMLSIGKDQ